MGRRIVLYEVTPCSVAQILPCRAISFCTGSYLSGAAQREGDRAMSKDTSQDERIWNGREGYEPYKKIQGRHGRIQRNIQGDRPTSKDTSQHQRMQAAGRDTGPHRRMWGRRESYGLPGKDTARYLWIRPP